MESKLRSLEFDPALRRRRTATDYVADALRIAILDGRFVDGEELNQVELAEHFNVSRVPVREALRQLQAEGLVSAESYRRTVVTGLSVERVAEIFDVRALLEGDLLEKAAPKIDDALLGRLRLLCDQMDEARDRYEWLARNREFHRALCEPSGSEVALALAEQLASRVERYVRRAGGVDRSGSAGIEHRKILAALERGDTSGARRELEHHIRRSSQDVIDTLTVNSSSPGTDGRDGASHPA